MFCIMYNVLSFQPAYDTSQVLSNDLSAKKKLQMSNKK